MPGDGVQTGEAGDEPLFIKFFVGGVLYSAKGKFCPALSIQSNKTTRHDFISSPSLAA